MKARLFCKTGPLAGAEFTFESEAMIGRNKSNSVSLSADGISNYHARISYDVDAKRWMLEDLNSRNGTRLDGMRVHAPEPLDDLHVITLAEIHDLIFQAKVGVTSEPERAETTPIAPPPAEDKTVVEDELLAPPPATGASSSPELTVADEEILAPPPAGSGPASVSAPAPELTVADEEILAPPPVVSAEHESSEEKTQMGSDAPAPPAETEKPALATGQFGSASYILTESRTGSSIELTEEEKIIGRIEECGIMIQDTSVSRRHAKISSSGGAVTISDLDSKNGVFVDGQRISSPTEITPESRVRIGDVDVWLKKG